MTEKVDFDDFAKDYREIHTKTMQISGADSDYFAEHKMISLSGVFPKNEFNFLDLGCGDGITAKYLYKHQNQAIYNGIDISELSINEAKQRGYKRANFAVFDGNKIPFEDNTFDFIFSACVFHHINFKLHPTLFAEVFRVLKKGGKFILWEHNPYNPITRHIVNTCPFDKDAVLLNKSYAKTTFKNAGFSSITTNFVLFFPRNKVFKFFLFLEKYLSWLPLGGQYFMIGNKPKN